MNSVNNWYVQIKWYLDTQCAFFQFFCGFEKFLNCVCVCVSQRKLPYYLIYIIQNFIFFAFKF